MLDTLRQTTRPMMARDLAVIVMKARGLDTEDAALVRVMHRRMDATLRHWTAKGVLRAMPGPGQRKVWQIA